jgi:hypothetical protein
MPNGTTEEHEASAARHVAVARREGRMSFLLGLEGLDHAHDAEPDRR